MQRAPALAGPAARVVALLGALLPACFTCPSAGDWLDAGFRSPEQTFRTFQNALAADEHDLGYRSLSGDFKRREGLTGLAYHEGLSELLRQKPWLRRAAEAEIVASERLDPERAVLVAEVDTLLYDVRVRVELVREDYYELWVEDDRAADGFAPFEELVRGSPDGLRLIGAAPLGGLEAGRVTEVRIGREWKVDSIVVIEDGVEP